MNNFVQITAQPNFLRPWIFNSTNIGVSFLYHYDTTWLITFLAHRLISSNISSIIIFIEDSKLSKGQVKRHTKEGIKTTAESKAFSIEMFFNASLAGLNLLQKTHRLFSFYSYSKHNVTPNRR